MSTLFIGILSCHADERNGCNQAVRDTWLKRNKYPYKFFVGAPAPHATDVLPDDVVQLPCDDDYMSLPHKTKLMCRFMLANYPTDYLYKCDRDTYVFTERFATCGFEKYDYLGHFPHHPVEETHLFTPNPSGHYGYASGGSGYFLSRRAVLLVANAPTDDWAEDRWVGSVLGRNGISGTHTERLWFKRNMECGGYKEVLACHLSHGTGMYSPSVMRQVHAYRKNFL